MLRSRVIPCLLIRNKGLVKTIKFKDPTYIGDPINAVRIFNEKKSDELIVLDIDATSQGCDPDYAMIERLARECRMPLCYGGGVKSIEQAKKIISLGVEKIALSSVVIDNPQIISDLSREVGSQSVVVVLDVKRRLMSSKYEVLTHNGKIRTGKCPFEFSKNVEALGCGEIVINSIDNDGVMKGYDMFMASRIRSSINTQVTILGGAGSTSDISELIHTFGIVGAGVGSLFVYKGVYKAVLINYPNEVERLKMIKCNDGSASEN